MFVIGENREYGEESLSWREIEQRRLAVDDYLAKDIRVYNNKMEDPTQGFASFYRYSEGDDHWNTGFGSSLDDIKTYLAKGGYMTESEIEQYVEKYLSDDFLENSTQQSQQEIP